MLELGACSFVRNGSNAERHSRYFGAQNSSSWAVCVEILSLSLCCLNKVGPGTGMQRTIYSILHVASITLPFSFSDNILHLLYLCYSLGTCSPFTGRCCNSLKAILFWMSFSSILTQDGYTRWFRIGNCFDPCWVWSEQLFFKGQSVLLLLFLLKYPFGGIHKSQVALRTPLQIIAFLKLHKNIWYIHLLGQVPTMCSKLIWFCHLGETGKF